MYSLSIFSSVEFLKGYNEWLYYMDITGAYEDFFERLNQNELLYKSN